MTDMRLLKFSNEDDVSIASSFDSYVLSPKNVMIDDSSRDCIKHGQLLVYFPQACGGGYYARK